MLNFCLSLKVYWGNDLIWSDFRYLMLFWCGFFWFWRMVKYFLCDNNESDFKVLFEVFGFLGLLCKKYNLWGGRLWGGVGDLVFFCFNLCLDVFEGVLGLLVFGMIEVVLLFLVWLLFVVVFLLVFLFRFLLLLEL